MCTAKSTSPFAAALTTMLSICTLPSNALADWPFQAGDFIPASPSIADLDGDGSLEIVFASWDGNCYCLDASGNQIWSTPLHDGTGFPPQLRSTPTVVDLDANPSTREVVIGSAQSKKLYCLGSDGQVLGTFDVPTSVHSSPLVTDLEGDGTKEILFGNIKTQFTPPASLYCLSVIKQPGGIKLAHRWDATYLEGSVFHAPAECDADGDGELEIIVSLGGTFGVSPGNGALYCLDKDGNQIWSFQLPGESVYNTPAIADIDGDGLLDATVAPFYGNVWCLDAMSGDAKWDFPNPGDSLLHSPGCAQLDDDPELETVIGSYGADILHCINGEGGQQWQHSFRPEWTTSSCPAIGDVDGDGDLEIAIGTGTAPELGTSSIYLFDHEGNVVWQKIMPSAVYSSPALADLDGDGFLEIAFGCYDHKFYVLDYQGNTFVPNPNTKPKDLAPWPTYRQNNQRTGFYPGPPKTPQVPGDIVPPPNGNGIVNVDDLLAVINSWGPCSDIDNCPADIAPVGGGNDVVDVDDLLMVINNWS